MKISYNWLKQFLTFDLDAQKTGEILTDLGLEVEGIEKFESVKGGLDGVVVGHVLSCEKHPNADRLKITSVDIGGENPVQIVCGAPNVAAGQKVPVATIGTNLYTAEGEEWTIKKGKIRGEESHGMICAEDELSLGESHDGIMVLDKNLTPGTPCSSIFNIELDEVFEIGLTPNRADAMSHFGTARDLYAGFKQLGHQAELNKPSSEALFVVDGTNSEIKVSVVNKDLAPRYAGIVIENLTVKESPDWLKNRLKAIGLNPINNIVDATNYILHDLGQPLHAFDLDKISGGEVVVKTLPKGTKFTTLDAIERELHEDDLMICDSEKPMCIAGVFGGIHSGVTETTKAIFLESAYFDPVSIRKSAKRHGLNTDASFRFERGIDINFVVEALKKAAMLIKELGGGTVSSEITDLFAKPIEDKMLFLAFKKVRSLIGQNIPEETMLSILNSLEIEVENRTEEGLLLSIPAYRVDVERDVDVIEDILRVYGYNNVATKSKFTTSIAGTSKIENHAIQDMVGNALVAQGFYEIMTNSLTPVEHKSYLNKESTAVHIMNPLSADLSMMRQSMLFSGLQTIVHNQNRKNTNLRLFEFGKTYGQQEGNNFENQHLSLFITGNENDAHWYTKETASSFFYLKGIVEGLLTRIGVDYKQFPLEADNLSEGILFKSKRKQQIVELGVVDIKTLNKFDIKSEVLYAEFNWDNILSTIQTADIKYAPVPKFPVVKRDLSLLIANEISFKEIHELAFNVEKKLLQTVTLFDVYTGNNLPEGKKSYALSFTLLDSDKTLSDKQIDKVMAKMQRTFIDKLGAELR